MGHTKPKSVTRTSQHRPALPLRATEPHGRLATPRELRAAAVMEARALALSDPTRRALWLDAADAHARAAEHPLDAVVVDLADALAARALLS